MNKLEFITAISEKTGQNKDDVEVIFSALFDVLTEALVKQDKITIPGFGIFSTKVREARKGRNPSTGAEIDIPKTLVANFKIAAQLKDKLHQASQK